MVMDAPDGGGIVSEEVIDGALLEEAPAMAEQPPSYDEVDNLAKVLPKAFLDKLGARVIKAAEDSRKSSEGWRQKTADHLDLYNGVIPDVGDQENIVPMHLPFSKRALRVFFSKLFTELYPPTGDIVNLKVRSPELEPVAEMCSTHMNFQLTNLIPEYIPSHDRGIKQILLQGSAFEVWWYDVVQKRPCQEICLAEDFWIPYTAKTDRPDMADVPYKTWRKRCQQHELIAYEAEDGYYIGITQAFDGHPDGGTTEPIYPDGMVYGEDGSPKDGGSAPTSSTEDRPVKEAADSHLGFEEQTNDPDAPREILEQDRMVLLPSEQVARMVTVCVDRQTERVLRVSFREMVDRQDLARYEREMQAHEMAVASDQTLFEQANAGWEATVLEHQAFGGVDPATGQPLPELMPPPEPPPPRQPPAPPRKVPWHRFTKGDCDTNPEGALGHGILHDVAGHNVLANKVATRGVSLLTLNVSPTLIMSRQSKFARGEQQLKLGAINESPLSPDQVRAGAGLFQLQFPPPDPNIYKIIEMADKNCQEITAFDIAAGGAGMSGETATESEMRNSNATANIAAVGQRINRWRAQSLKNLAYINSLTLPEEGVTVWRDGQPIVVTRQHYDMILSELEVTFTCDQSFESKPIKERRAMKLYQTIDQLVNTPVAGTVPAVDPMIGVQLKRAAAAMVLEAAGAPKQWIEMITSGPSPMQGQGPAGPEGAGPNGQGQGQGQGQAGPAPGAGGPMDGAGPGPADEIGGGPEGSPLAA